LPTFHIYGGRATHLILTSVLGQNDTNKVVWTKWYGQNGTNKTVPIKSSINLLISLQPTIWFFSLIQLPHWSLYISSVCLALFVLS